MGLERLWKRLHRRYLERFSPDLMQRLRGQRQGECPECGHDVCIPADLKLYRNVCGYHFGPENDPFAGRSRLPLARAGRAELVFFSLLFLAATVLFGLLAIFASGLFWIPLAVALVFWGFVISFFRDPERIPPSDPQALLSPADGRVTHVDEILDPEFPGGRAFRISIFLSVFNVHINRVPRTARVVAVRYFPGCFLDARHPECSVRNEQLWLDLEEPESGRFLRVKQISGAIARRIVCWVRPGELVQAGQRFGMIKFGSRTEVLLRVGEERDVLVKAGDRVKGGSTVLLRFARVEKDSSGTRAASISS